MSDPAHYLKPRNRHRLPVWGLAAVLTLGAAWLGREALLQGERQEEAQQQAERLRAGLRPKPVPKPSRSELDIQRRWAALQSERAFDWYPIFNALEQASSDDIELLEFAPDKGGKRLVLRGEARDVAALLSYAESLAEQPAFGQVYLSHHKGKASGSLQTVTFEIRTSLNE
ncbi:hypothetical protein [Massilia endophytica]|uniref:hypothetical protein n=1 Tax=Massilia endophytica TaxID=2899220 RepID=UPI001E388471|nr:hypothetical protein [Massilia endophytica]UGQ48741.1 hypothetical protein LSQ66_09855 [Massilia endophytica]